MKSTERLFAHLQIGLTAFLLINEIDVFNLRFSGSVGEECGLLAVTCSSLEGLMFWRNILCPSSVSENKPIRD
jgi:hypothetical protein